jgi:hypothetical protein
MEATSFSEQALKRGTIISPALVPAFATGGAGLGEEGASPDGRAGREGPMWPANGKKWPTLMFARNHDLMTC